jgi:hypothetical protein
MESKMNRKSGGPRTPQGKARSKFNAVKHGLLSKCILLPGESAAEYKSLLNGMLDDFQPQGTLETVLVDNLATLFWRKHRLSLAEYAEISKKTEFSARDFVAKQHAEAWDCARATSVSGGSLKYLLNSFVVQDAKQMLEIMRDVLIPVGINIDNAELMKKLYGEDQDRGIPYGFRLFFELYAQNARLAAERGDHSAAAKCKQLIVELINSEIERLTHRGESLQAEDAERLAYESIAAIIPDQGVSDRLMRYETHLSREIDRILKWLERLQQRRKDQLVPPQIDVTINS